MGNVPTALRTAGNVISRQAHLSRRRQHLRGGRSCERTSRCAGSATLDLRSPRTPHRPGQRGPGRGRNAPSQGPTPPCHRPAAGTRPGRRGGPSCRHTPSPSCRCGAAPRGPRTGGGHCAASGPHLERQTRPVPAGTLPLAAAPRKTGAALSPAGAEGAALTPGRARLRAMAAAEVPWV